MSYFQIASRSSVLHYVQVRRFETKLGEVIPVPASEDMETILNTFKGKFVILGIPEDIGVKANYGIAGAHTAWPSFLQSFLNIQSNEWLPVEQMLLLGAFDFTILEQVIEDYALPMEERIEAYRKAVHTIDEAVYHVIKAVVLSGKMPIVIGGGHNNAYPLIRATAKALHHLSKTSTSAINVVNLDAHLDFRVMEGRHSGNGFRYAFDEGFLHKYCVVAPQENYLQQSVMNSFLYDQRLDFISYEDIFLQDKYTFEQAVAHAITFTKHSYCGVELDLDIIEKTLSSAYTPSGISTMLARKYLIQMARYAQPAYLHICEGIAQHPDGRISKDIGKLISFMVTDFVKELIIDN